MPTLLTRQPLTEAKALAEVYVVYDGADYRMTLETLVSLVSKASLGLSNIDNTKDADKPLSTAMIAALMQKADSNNVVSSSAFQEAIQDFVTQSQLETAINEVKAIINQTAGLTPAQVQAMITTALEPITTSLTTFQQSLQVQAQELQQIQQALPTFALKTDIDIRFSSLEQNLGNQISQLSNNIGQALQTVSETNASEIARLEDAAAAQNQAVAQQIQSLVGQIESVTQLVSALRMDFDEHTHTVDDIIGLRAVVEEMVSELPAGDCNVAIGSNEW